MFAPSTRARRRVGCCWALMLLMVVVGAGSLDWMLALALAATMAIEKNAAWGRRVTRRSTSRCSAARC
ncbi:hypothetical protein WK48_18475 [Burkholderia ubonensis]|nr:hypothetical protein WK48_18475 [Burkholderia ubonensis]KVW60167.1 hypothetical protein WK98_01430 [Burkholderia ubonensis]KWB86375.1 hypothetical protein WL42_31680 [Burkholderia ubonensis]KWN56906.1 hypothetical protein WM23_19970 [Burkholderia ubonensis]